MTNLLAFRRASSVPPSEVEPAAETEPAAEAPPAPAAPAATAVGAPAAAVPASGTPAVIQMGRRGRFGRSGLGRVGRSRSSDERVAQLQASPLLAGWSETDVTALAACADEAIAVAGQVIEEDVYPYRWWWLVLEGTVAVSSEGEPATVLGPGHAVGLDRPEHSHRRVTLTALDDVRMLAGPRQRVIGAADTNRRIHDLVHRSLGR